MQAAPQFLNGENNSGKRCVERRCQPACRAGGNLFVRTQTAEGETVAAAVRAPGEHHRRADLYRRALAPDRGTNQHGEEGQRDFPQRLRPGDEAVFVGAVGQAKRGDNLRNTAAGDKRRVFLREPRQKHHARRQNEPRRIRPGSRPKLVFVERIIGEGGEGE